MNISKESSQIGLYQNEHIGVVTNGSSVSLKSGLMTTTQEMRGMMTQEHFYKVPSGGPGALVDSNSPWKPTEHTRHKKLK